MTAISVSAPFPILTDIDGSPLNAGYVYIGQPNLDPVAFPKAAYWDASLTTPAAQPIRTTGGYPVRNGSPARIYTDGDYSIRINNKNWALVYSSPASTERMDSEFVGYDGGTVRDVLDAVTGPSGAASVGYTPAGTGAVTTTVQSKLRETVSVCDYGLVDLTGTVSAQAVVVTAVAAAYTAGADLYWPDGIYLTTGNIPNFHNVRHVGPGVIKRGVDLFHIRPKGTNTNKIYVDSTGSDSNDGLSASQPLQTIQSSFDALKNSWLSAMIEGVWRIVLSAGTYSRATFNAAALNTYRLQVVGPSASFGVPTAIIDGQSVSSVAGLYFQGVKNIQVSDVKFINFPGTNGQGLVAEGDCDLYAVNIHADGCGWCGINHNVGGQLRVQGGLFKNCRYGIRTYSNVTYTIGYNSQSNPTVIQDCTEAGFYGQNASMGHVDYSQISGCATGIALVNCSRAHIIETSVSTCNTGVSAVSGSTYIKTNVTFTGNTADELCYGNSIDYENAFYDRFEPNNLRWVKGYGLSGASISSVYKHVFELGNSDSGIQILSPNATIANIAFGRAANNVAGRLAYDHNTDTFRLITNGANKLFLSSTSMLPLPDNTVALGASGNRWTQVYAATGTINTSDEREKQDIAPLDAVELRVALALRGAVKKFRFRDAVTKKGVEARIHFGVIAQEVIQAFQNEGLDPMRYGVICYDEWPAEFDDDGNEVRPAGNRYGVRYEELMAFIIGAM